MNELCRRYAVDEGLVHRAIASGYLVAFRLGRRRWRIWDPGLESFAIAYLLDPEAALEYVPLFTTPQVCVLAGLSEKALCVYQRQNKLRPHYIQGRKYFTLRDVRQLLEDRKEKLLRWALRRNKDAIQEVNRLYDIRYPDTAATAEH